MSIRMTHLIIRLQRLKSSRLKISVKVWISQNSTRVPKDKKIEILKI